MVGVPGHQNSGARRSTYDEPSLATQLIVLTVTSSYHKSLKAKSWLLWRFHCGLQHPPRRTSETRAFFLRGALRAVDVERVIRYARIMSESDGPKCRHPVIIILLIWQKLDFWKLDVSGHHWPHVEGRGEKLPCGRVLAELKAKGKKKKKSMLLILVFICNFDILFNMYVLH